jgi:hypothetical protein
MSRRKNHPPKKSYWKSEQAHGHVEEVSTNQRMPPSSPYRCPREENEIAET